MPEQFTVEEVNLMCIFDTSDRRGLIIELIGATEDFEDDMLEIASPLITKLSKMSDADFAALALYPEYMDYDDVGGVLPYGVET